MSNAKQNIFINQHCTYILGTLLSKMNTHKIMTTSFMDKTNNKIHIRNCSTPNAELKEIQEILKSKPVPFYRKKDVAPQ